MVAGGSSDDVTQSGLEEVACPLRLLCTVEEVRVDAQGDVGRTMPELSGGEDDVRASADEEAREGMPQVVPAQRLDARRLERRFERTSRNVSPVQRRSNS